MNSIEFVSVLGNFITVPMIIKLGLQIVYCLYIIVLSCVCLFLCRFMDNLQTEVLEVEFLAYSKGMTTISEEDFARILLRYTTVDNISSYLENVRQSIPDEKVKIAGLLHPFT